MDYAKLGTYCKVISGYAFKSSDWQDEGIPVIKIGNISNGCDVILDEQTQYVDDVFSKSSTQNTESKKVIF